MATYQEIWNLKTASFNLKQRVAVAVAKAAQDVLNEDPGTANHANRVLWATNALVNAEQEAERFMWPVCGNSTIQAKGDASADSDIQWVVNGYIDKLATGA